ncbi:hypothetical protein C8T65DRAFT_293426 [Cerioporus squamosus]|nr:hypothetical protein C8T65DRAFT_293426 [Cerioporus squamosus]
MRQTHARVAHLLWRVSLGETFGSATVCERPVSSSFASDGITMGPLPSAAIHNADMSRDESSPGPAMPCACAVVTIPGANHQTDADAPQIDRELNLSRRGPGGSVQGYEPTPLAFNKLAPRVFTPDTVHSPHDDWPAPQCHLTPRIACVRSEFNAQWTQ